LQELLIDVEFLNCCLRYFGRHFCATPTFQDPRRKLARNKDTSVSAATNDCLGSVEIQDSHGGLVLIQTPKREQSMTRFVLTDAQWGRIEPHCLGKATDPGRTGGNARRFFEAVLWIARTGSPWRDLPEDFGRWNTVFKRFRHWVKVDVFKRIFDALSGDPDLEFAMVDGSIVKVHRHGQGAKGGLKARPSAARAAAGARRSSP
jgi:transposase